MKKFALIGGIGPASTVQYYEQIINGYRERLQTEAYPELTIHSINMTEMLRFVFAGNLDGLTSFLLRHIKALESMGFEIAALASNTPHIVFDRLQEATDLQLISIVESTCQKIKSEGYSKVGLFGTQSTMTAGFYQQTAKAHGIEISIPNSQEMDYIHEKYFQELVFHDIKSATKNRLIEIAMNSKYLKGIEGLILGGTELSLILGDEDFPHLTIYDTTKIHVESIISEIIE